MVVHRTEACTCCGAYEDILAAAGFEVEQQMHDRLAPIRAELGVPEEAVAPDTLRALDRVEELLPAAGAADDVALIAIRARPEG